MKDFDTCKNAIPWASLFSMIIGISGCVFFTLSFADGMEGFLFQLNTISKMFNPSLNITLNTISKMFDPSLNITVRSMMFKIAAIFCFSVIIFLVINVFATSALSIPTSAAINERRRKSGSNEPQFLLYRILSNSRTIAFAIGFAHTILVFWIFILCISSMAFISYLIFYISMQQFCIFVDNQCFDFRILIPVVKKLTNDVSF
uniref:Uncharacterized protein n=1 Tax=Panagrolaimus sp. PS1159 TaxID=55785 RepID=A0AC35GK76_9BILA